MKKTNRNGFTLVELVIVIAVIAILAGVLIGTFASVISRANQNAALQKAKAAVDEAYVEYVAEYHKAPTSIKVTQDSNTFVSVEFGENTVTSNDQFRGFIILESSRSVVLNNVDGQKVYFNWNESGTESTYSVETSPSGTTLSDVVISNAEKQVDEEIGQSFTVPTYVHVEKDGEKFVSITKYDTIPTAGTSYYELTDGYITLGTTSDASAETMYLNITGTNVTVEITNTGNQLTLVENN